MGKSKIQEVHEVVRVFAEDVVVLKTEFENLKECVAKIDKNVEGINKKLFVSNSHKSFVGRLESLEEKAKLIWIVSGTVGLLALKTIWDVMTR